MMTTPSHDLIRHSSANSRLSISLARLSSFIFVLHPNFNRLSTGSVLEDRIVAPLSTRRRLISNYLFSFDRTPHRRFYFLGNICLLIIVFYPDLNRLPARAVLEDAVMTSFRARRWRVIFRC